MLIANSGQCNEQSDSDWAPIQDPVIFQYEDIYSLKAAEVSDELTPKDTAALTGTNKWSMVSKRS